MDKKNIIFILIDTLRYDFVGYNGFNPNISPTIDYLRKNGFVATSMYSTGCPTQMALPAVFTSTYPLDEGGYEKGLLERGESFVEILQSNKNNTLMSYSNAFMLGFGRGFNDIYYCASIDIITQSFNNRLKRVVLNYYDKRMSLTETINFSKYIFDELFQAIQKYCLQKINNKDEQIRSAITDNNIWNYERIYQFISEEYKSYLADWYNYISVYLEQELYRESRKRTRSCALFDFISSINNSNIQKTNRKLAKWQRNLESLSFDLRLHNIRNSSASLQFNHLIKWIEQNKKNPYFAYIHCNDVHPPCNFMSFDELKWCAQEEWEEINNIVSNFINQTKTSIFKQNSVNSLVHLIKQGINKNYRKEYKKVLENRIRYLLSINYVDKQIKKLLGFLETTNSIDDTIIVITSDHGTHYPGSPYRFNGHVTRSFFDEFYHIPFIIFNKDIPRKSYTGLCSSIDIAPTILDLAGCESPKSYKGISLLKTTRPRKYVIMENMGNGICHFRIKPITVAIRSKKYKVVYQAIRINGGIKGRVKEVYNLEKDPLEKKNLAKNMKECPMAYELVNNAKNRIREIYKQNN